VAKRTPTRRRGGFHRGDGADDDAADGEEGDTWHRGTKRRRRAKK